VKEEVKEVYIGQETDQKYEGQEPVFLTGKVIRPMSKLMAFIVVLTTRGISITFREGEPWVFNVLFKWRDSLDRECSFHAYVSARDLMAGNEDLAIEWIINMMSRENLLQHIDWKDVRETIKHHQNFLLSSDQQTTPPATDQT
jgi:hypothetical protein